jgi:hypothetical protein
MYRFGEIRKLKKVRRLPIRMGGFSVNKQDWPAFPLSWIDKSERNISAFPIMASTLHNNDGRASRLGFVGEANEMEKQLIRNVISLEQQVYVLTDVAQCLMQIIADDYERRWSQKAKRLFARICRPVTKLWHVLERNIAYRILAVVSTVLTIVVILWPYLGRFLHALKR